MENEDTTPDTKSEETPEQAQETPQDQTSESQEQNNDTKTKEEEVKEGDEEEEAEPVEMVEVPKSRLEELENAEEKFMEELKRERAESINYRKRLQKQRDQFSEMASARVLSKVLAVQDDLKRVIDNANGEIPESHLEGIQLVKQRLEGIFEQEGVELIKIEEGKTKYDPREMEAVVSQPIPDVEPNTVVGVINQGFKKGERVLRAAKVMISKAPPENQKEGKEDQEGQSEDKSDQDTQKDLATGKDNGDTAPIPSSDAEASTFTEKTTESPNEQTTEA